jgi:hypothetical protein
MASCIVVAIIIYENDLSGVRGMFAREDFGGWCVDAEVSLIVLVLYQGMTICNEKTHAISRAQIANTHHRKIVVALLIVTVCGCCWWWKEEEKKGSVHFMLCQNLMLGQGKRERVRCKERKCDALLKV